MSFASPLALLLLTMSAAVVVDLISKAIARAERLSAVAPHTIDPSVMVWCGLAAALTLMLVSTARVPHRPPSWIYGGGVAWGGALANMIELKMRGSVTDFIVVAGRVATPADVAILVGLAVWWGGVLVRVIRGRPI